MKRIVPIGDGRHVQIEEGALKKPLPVHKQIIAIPPNSNTHWQKFGRIVGFREWVGRRRHQIYSLTNGGEPGVPTHLTSAQISHMRKKVEKLVKRDMENIKKAGVDLGDAGNEALTETLRIMRATGDSKTRLQAARQVLEWTKAKPVAESKVTVASAEAWLDSLGDNANTTNNEAADS